MNARVAIFDASNEPLEASGVASRLMTDIVAAIKTVYDPEIPVDIYELGLIYDIALIGDTDNKPDVKIEMTLTSPACPMAGEIPANVSYVVEKVEGVGKVEVDLVWDPPWDHSRMSEEAQVALNMF